MLYLLRPLMLNPHVVARASLAQLLRRHLHREDFPSVRRRSGSTWQVKGDALLVHGLPEWFYNPDQIHYPQPWSCPRPFQHEPCCTCPNSWCRVPTPAPTESLSSLQHSAPGTMVLSAAPWRTPTTEEQSYQRSAQRRVETHATAEPRSALHHVPSPSDSPTKTGISPVTFGTGTSTIWSRNPRIRVTSSQICARTRPKERADAATSQGPPLHPLRRHVGTSIHAPACGTDMSIRAKNWPRVQGSTCDFQPTVEPKWLRSSVVVVVEWL